MNSHAQQRMYDETNPQRYPTRCKFLLDGYENNYQPIASHVKLILNYAIKAQMKLLH